MKLTQEIIEKAKAAGSAEELLAIAKENGIDMTADEAKTYFEQLNANSLDDDLLEGVAGGWLILHEDALGSGKQEDNRDGNKKGQCGS
jgi:predicted ribosomally synthesized peptide with nif11-like leader